MTEGQQTQIKQEIKKPIWKKWWFWAIAVFVIIIIASADSGEKKEIKLETILPAQEQPTSKQPKIEILTEAKDKYETYKKQQDSSGKLQKIIIIPTEFRDEKNLFLICDELNKETINQKNILIRGFTNKTAADYTLLIDESPDVMFKLSDEELKAINYAAVLAFDKSLTLTPLKWHHCEIYPGGFDNPPFGKIKEY